MLFKEIVLILSVLYALVDGKVDQLWPLNNKTYTAEIIQSSGISTECGMNFGTDHLNGLFPVSLVDDATIDLPVKSSVDSTGKDYSFAGWFKPFEVNSGLFHYKANNNLAVFQEMKLVINAQYLQATRILNGVVETEISISHTVTTTYWHFISFGISQSTGELVVKLDGNIVIQKAYTTNINIELPGVLRIGGTFDNSNPTLNGYVTCFGFYTDDNMPTQTDTFKLCQMQHTTLSYAPICSRRNTVQFVKNTSITNGIQEIRNSSKCSVFQCAVDCLSNRDCRYIQYNPTHVNCTMCLLLKQGHGVIDQRNGRLYKLNI